MRRFIVTIALLLATATVSAGTNEAVSVRASDSVAIGGHDTVAYHSTHNRQSHQQIQGNSHFEVHWSGATWRFASLASANRFAADPERYRPAYNGFCSNALSLDEGLIPTDGSVWEFFGDQLHLFYAERGRQRWLNGDWQHYKAQADQAWESLKIR